MGARLTSMNPNFMVCMHLAKLCSMSTMQFSIGVSIAWASLQRPSVTAAMEERLRFPELRTNTQRLRRCLFECKTMLFLVGFRLFGQTQLHTRCVYFLGFREHAIHQFAKCCSDSQIEQCFVQTRRLSQSTGTVRRLWLDSSR